MISEGRLQEEFHKLGYTMDINLSEAHNLGFKLFKMGSAMPTLSYQGDSLEGVLGAMVVQLAKSVEVHEDEMLVDTLSYL